MIRKDNVIMINFVRAFYDVNIFCYAHLVQPVHLLCENFVHQTNEYANALL